MPKVSIIVPVYNTEKYLEKCLDSLINQTFKDIEIIVVNDGSTDGSQEIIDNYRKKCKKIKCFMKKNGGQASARNLGIINSKSKYITFVDSDDYIELNFVDSLYKNIIDNNADISICNINKVFNEKKLKFSNYKSITNNNIKNFIISHPGPVARLYKKDLFLLNKIFFPENLKLYEDLGTIPILGCYNPKIKYIEEYLYNYMIREESSMHQQKYSRKLLDIYTALDNVTEAYIKEGKYDDYHEEIEYLYIEHLLRSASLRFAKYQEGELQINKISKIMKFKFHLWKKNFYFSQSSAKMKLICFAAYNKKIKILRLIDRLISK